MNRTVMKLAAIGTLVTMSPVTFVSAAARPYNDNTRMNNATDGRIHVAVSLQVQHVQQLNDRIAAVSSVVSPKRNQTLTEASFRQTYAPTAEQIATVSSYLTERGLTVDHVAKNGLILDVSGPRRSVQQTFATGSTSANPMPASVAHLIAGVVGLTPSAVQHPHAIVHPRGAGGVGGYTPAQIHQAYDYNRVYTQWQGRGQTIAIVTSGKVNVTDVQQFDAAFKLPDPNVTQISIDGTNKSTDEETTLDVEWAHAMAPTASIRVYEAANPDDASFIDAFNQVASDDIARVVSTSWGGPESQSSSATMKSEHAIFQEMAAQGQAMFAASGDDGSSDGTSGKAVDYPASDPYVTACGGTSATLDASGNRLNEVAWTGSGGGKSDYFGQPNWQYGPGVAQLQARQTADISLNANPQTGYDFYYRGSWYIGGGTSFVAPEMAATFALIDQSRASQGKSSIGLANRGIYALARSGSYAGFTYHDVTSGSNGAYSAQFGYDYPTGWGSIDAYYFLHGLN